jgi:hypothetical protein
LHPSGSVLGIVQSHRIYFSSHTSQHPDFDYL